MKKKLRIKNLSIIVILFIFGISPIFAAPCGDVNSSGDIGIIDALMTAQYYVGLNPQPFDVSVADVSGDGAINIIDALQIAQYYVGLINSFTGCQAEPTPINETETYELQAETGATWDNAQVDSIHTGYTGSGFVDTVNTSGTWIQWRIDVASGTNAYCEFRYACASDARSMDLIVNGSLVTNLTFPASGSWTTWATETATMGLNPGSNTIRLVATTSGGGPNIDKMNITVGTTIVTATPTLPPTPTPTPGSGTQPSQLVGWATQNGGVTGGAGGSTVTVSSKGDLESACSGSTTRIVKISGTISGSGMMSVGSNKTIIGNSGATISGFGFDISEEKNVIIQNIIFKNANDDSINISSYSTNMWVDHCSFSSGSDGLLDIKRGSSFITVSYNHFSNHHKTCLLGHSDDNASQDVGNLKVTYHHNYFAGSDTRNPRVRFGHVHVFNNYYTNNDYGVASCENAFVLVEGNYFDGCGSPTLTQYGASDSGNLNERNNIFKNSGSPKTRGSVPGFPYNYTLDNASDIPSIVSSNAGAGKM